MKKKGLIILIAVVAVIVLLVGGGISVYNGLIGSEETVNQYKSDIESNLQRRADLIPNLVETVKGYAAHEEEVYLAISNARADMLSAGNLSDAAQADADLNTALSRLLAISEAYPELKANENFIALQTQLEGTENRINVARIKYNEAASSFNTQIRKFPNSIVAGIIGLEKADYFEAKSGAENAPSVSFDK